MAINPLEAMRQRNAANGLPAKLTGGQKAGVSGGAIAAILAATLAGVYVNEGGYANHKADRGGETNFGITIGTARAAGYTGAMKDFPKHCTAEKPICADKIYTDEYIKAPGFLPMATIEPAVLYELVDSGVVHGTRRPSEWFRASINELCGTRFPVYRYVVSGGRRIRTSYRVDAETTDAYDRCADTLGRRKICVAMLDRLDLKQEAFFRSIVANNSSQRVFLKGWLRMRIGNVDRKKCTEGL
jgi:hypothetical protein